MLRTVVSEHTHEHNTTKNNNPRIEIIYINKLIMYKSYITILYE